MKTPPGHLLVADDDRMSRMLLCRSLTQVGHKIDQAENGLQALEMIRTNSYDAVLLDLMMPEMDGYQVLEQLVADGFVRHTPVIMVSGFEEIAGVVTCLELGAEDYVHKPFEPSLLRARIDNSLIKKRLLDSEVSLRQQLEDRYAELTQLERQRESLVDMIVHDLRTPLTALIGGLATIGDLGELNADQQEFLGISQQSGETLLHMINDLLDISKSEDGSLRLERAALAAEDLAARAMRQVAPLAAEKELELTWQVNQSAALLHGDAEKLRRLLVNLLGNAIKFTPRHGRVTLLIDHGGDEAETVITVSDTGEGIPREDFDRIFEKFGQVESRKAGRMLSTGLGLTFCRMVAEAHGGRIWVESELGAGSTFFVALPLNGAA
jgi:signal transduction histidine kinase